jgi:hypothetical protein
MGDRRVTLDGDDEGLDTNFESFTIPAGCTRYAVTVVDAGARVAFEVKPPGCATAVPMTAGEWYSPALPGDNRRLAAATTFDIRVPAGTGTAVVELSTASDD